MRCKRNRIGWGRVEEGESEGGLVVGNEASEPKMPRE